MSLSPRAIGYLATMKRRDSVSLVAVETSLTRAGVPVFDQWLSFHSRFAGYEEVIGNEVAIWGIMHHDPIWLNPDEVAVEFGKDGWRVVCADVHPSYDYWLDSKGQMVGLGNGGPFETFDVKVERDAVFWEACAQGRSWEINFPLTESPMSIELLRESIPGLEIVPEASDKYGTCSKSNDVIVVERGGRKTIWVASGAAEEIRRLIQRFS
jgi:hypothetical protein